MKARVNLFMHVQPTHSAIIFKCTFWFDYIFFFNFLDFSFCFLIFLTVLTLYTQPSFYYSMTFAANKP